MNTVVTTPIKKIRAHYEPLVKNYNGWFSPKFMQRSKIRFHGRARTVCHGGLPLVSVFVISKLVPGASNEGRLFSVEAYDWAEVHLSEYMPLWGHKEEAETFRDLEVTRLAHGLL